MGGIEGHLPNALNMCLSCMNLEGIHTMTVLRIFGDEAGTMPQDDADGVFTAATVATLNEVPTMEQPSGHVSWLIEQLKVLNATPSVAFVKPKPGYGKAFTDKLQKMDTMARVTRLITGANSKYLTKDGLGPRNYLWVHLMGQSIKRAVVAAILRTEVTAIEITLDQKTMAASTRTLFDANSLKIRKQLMTVLEKARRIDLEKAALYESRVKFSPNSISICFSDETRASGAEGGLRLAHYLATLYRKGLMKDGESGIQTRLRENGFTSVEIDCTDLLLAPLDRRTIRKWEISTGLRKPKP
jgi:hypothetical protein